MSVNPTTFQGESSGDSGQGWDDSAILLKRENTGLDFAFHKIRSGTFADLIAFVLTLPENEQGNYSLQKLGDRRFEIGEVRAIARHDDFPRQ